MSKTKDEIIRGLKELLQTENIAVGTVKSVDESAMTAVVLADDIEYQDVRLTAVNNDDSERSCIIPATDSYVLVGFVEGSDTDAFIVLFSQIEKIITKATNIEITVDKKYTEKSETYEHTADEFLFKGGKYQIDGDTTSLKTILLDLVKALKALTVTTPVGPSGTPINVAQFVKVENQINQLFK